jgi:bacteriocin resistance YdeI/OmpD-like protein/uncharacterized protein DUF1905
VVPDAYNTAMAETFRTVVKSPGTGNATGLPVPDGVVAALGSSRNPAVTVTVAGTSYRSTVAVRDGGFILPLSAALRAATGLKAGDDVEVTIELDTAPRTIDVPADLAAALAGGSGTRAAFDALSYSRQRALVEPVEAATTPETRSRRIASVLDKLA